MIRYCWLVVRNRKIFTLAVPKSFSAETLRGGLGLTNCDYVTIGRLNKSPEYCFSKYGLRRQEISINQSSINIRLIKVVRRNLKELRYWQCIHGIKIAKKIESYEVLCSVTSFVQHTYKKVSVIELRHLANKLFGVGACIQVIKLNYSSFPIMSVAAFALFYIWSAVGANGVKFW